MVILVCDVLLWISIFICSDATTCDATTCDIPGFNPPAQKCLAITFHVLVPTKVWEWTEDSHIHLVFGHHKMGMWEQPVGDFGAPSRYVCVLILHTSAGCFQEIHRKRKDLRRRFGPLLKRTKNVNVTYNKNYVLYVVIPGVLTTFFDKSMLTCHPCSFYTSYL